MLRLLYLYIHRNVYVLLKFNSIAIEPTSEVLGSSDRSTSSAMSGWGVRISICTYCSVLWSCKASTAHVLHSVLDIGRLCWWCLVHSQYVMMSWKYWLTRSFQIFRSFLPILHIGWKKDWVLHWVFNFHDDASNFQQSTKVPLQLRKN